MMILHGNERGEPVIDGIICRTEDLARCDFRVSRRLTLHHMNLISRLIRSFTEKYGYDTHCHAQQELIPM